MKGLNKETIARGAANRIIAFQLRLANWLNHKTCYWNKSAKVTALLLFILLFGGISLWLLIQSIY